MKWSNVLLALIAMPAFASAWVPSFQILWKAKAAATIAAIITSQTLPPLPAGAEETPFPGGTLKAPTPEQPQIQLPADRRSLTPDLRNNKDPIMQGLVYLRNPESDTRPSPTDTVVLTACQPSTPDTAIAGAKISVSKVRFPFQFRMFQENLLSIQLKEWAQAEEDDIIITARVCPESSTSLPCSDEESTLKARGVSKAIRNLPGMQEGEIIHTAASLALE